MPTQISQRTSPFDQRGRLGPIPLNAADAYFFIILFFLWVELGYRTSWQTPGPFPELTTGLGVCDIVRLLLSAATILGVNIVKNIELGHDISIFHRITLPSNDCESFAMTAMLALCFFSLRRFVAQGIIFLVIPAFDYYMCLLMHLLEALVDHAEQMVVPLSSVAALERHRHQLLPPDDTSEITTPSLTPPSPPPRCLVSHDSTPKFQPRQSFSSGTSPTLSRKEQNALLHQNKVGHKSPPQSGGRCSSKTSIRRPPIDDSPLNPEELLLYQLVTRNSNTDTIQSSVQLRVLFRLDIPLHLQELLEKQAAVESSLKCTSHAATQNSPISMIPSTSDATSQPTKKAEPAPATPETPTLAPTPRLTASEKGKWRATSSNSAPATSPLDSNPGISLLAPKLPSDILDIPLVWESGPVIAVPPVVALSLPPRAPSKALNKGKGQAVTSNSSLSSPTLPRQPSISSSAPPPSILTPKAAPARLDPIAPIDFSPPPHIASQPQIPTYPVDGDGDCIMGDLSEESRHPIPISLGKDLDISANAMSHGSVGAHAFNSRATSGLVASVEPVSEMEITLTSAELESMEIIPTVMEGEHSPGSMETMEVFLGDLGVTPMETTPLTPESMPLTEEEKEFAKLLLGWGEHSTPMVLETAAHEVAMESTVVQEAVMELAHETPVDGSGIWAPMPQEQQMGFETPSAPLRIEVQATPVPGLILPAAGTASSTYTSRPPAAALPQTLSKDKGKGKEITSNLFIPKRPSPLKNSFSLADLSQPSTSYAAPAVNVTMGSTADCKDSEMEKVCDALVVSKESVEYHTAKEQAATFLEKIDPELQLEYPNMAQPVQTAPDTSTDVTAGSAPRVIAQASRPRPMRARAPVAPAATNPAIQCGVTDRFPKGCQNCVEQNGKACYINMKFLNKRGKAAPPSPPPPAKKALLPHLRAHDDGKPIDLPKSAETTSEDDGPIRYGEE